MFDYLHDWSKKVFIGVLEPLGPGVLFMKCSKILHLEDI